MAIDPSAPAASNAALFGLDAQVDEAALVALAVPFDATTSYHQGAARGPNAIVAASHQIDLFDLDYGRPYAAGIAWLADDGTVAALNAEARAAAAAARKGPATAAATAIAQVDACGARVNGYVGALAARHFARGQIVATVGGDHSTPYAAIAAAVAQFPAVTVLHVDAHADLRVAYEGFTWSHASIMHNVLARLPLTKLVQVGVRDLCEEEYAAIAQSGGRIVPFFERQLAAHAMAGRGFAELADAIADACTAEVYISFDIDGLDPRFCPNTGTPVPGGLDFRQAEALLLALRRKHRRIVGFDLTEVAPSRDERNDWDANVGARLLYKMCGLALSSHVAAAHKSGPPTPTAL